MLRVIIAVQVISVSLFTGCSKPSPEIVPAEGLLFMNGKPLPRAQVRLFPTAELGPEFIAQAVTDESGKFSLRCNGQDGAPVGTSLVTVSEADPPDELLGETAQAALTKYLRSLKNRPIPPRYGTLVSSGITVTITSDQAPIELSLSR